MMARGTRVVLRLQERRPYTCVGVTEAQRCPGPLPVSARAAPLGLLSGQKASRQSPGRSPPLLCAPPRKRRSCLRAEQLDGQTRLAFPAFSLCWARYETRKCRSGRHQRRLHPAAGVAAGFTGSANAAPRGRGDGAEPPPLPPSVFTSGASTQLSVSEGSLEMKTRSGDVFRWRRLHRGERRRTRGGAGGSTAAAGGTRVAAGARCTWGARPEFSVTNRKVGTAAPPHPRVGVHPEPPGDTEPRCVFPHTPPFTSGSGSRLPFGPL